MVRQLEGIQPEATGLFRSHQALQAVQQQIGMRIAGQQGAPPVELGQHGNAAAVRLTAVAGERTAGQLLDVDRAHDLEPGRHDHFLRFAVRIEASLPARLFPHGMQLQELFRAGRQQGQLHAARQLPLGQRAGVGDLDRAGLEFTVPRQVRRQEPGGQPLALHGAKLFKVRLPQVLVAVEPDVVKGDVDLALSQQLEHPTDVVRVNVRDDQQVELPLILGQGLHPPPDFGVGANQPAVHQHPVGMVGIAILDPQTVALAGG